METTGQPGHTRMPSTRQRLRHHPWSLSDQRTVDPGLDELGGDLDRPRQGVANRGSGLDECHELLQLAPS